MQITLFFLVACAAVIAQSSLANLLTWGGARVELLPALVAYAAISTRWPLALWLAVVGGILLDALSANRLGVSAVALCVVAVAGFLTRGMVYREQWLAQFLIGGAASLVASLVLGALLAMSGLSWAASLAGVLRILQVALMSLIVAPLMFHALDWIRARVGESEEERNVA